MAAYPQFGDLPQIPSFSEEQHYHTTWHNDHHMVYRHHLPYGAEEYEQMPVFNTTKATHTMERFLVEESPLSVGMLQAKMPSYTHHERYELWPAPEHARYNSPGGTSVSGRSSHATQNEVCSPHTFDSASYGSPEEYRQPPFTYPSSELPQEQLYAHELPHPGGSMTVPFSNCNPRDVEYEHAPEPEPVSEEVEPMLLDNDAAYEPDPSCKVESTPTTYKEYADPGAASSVRKGESVQPMETVEPSEEDSSDAEYTPNRSIRRRSSASTSGSSRQGQRRRPHHGRKNSSPTTPHKVNKRSSNGTKSSNTGSRAHNVSDNSQRNFPCPLAVYGCQSTFSSKNEWKRHVSTQHIKLIFYRCTLCATTVDPYDDQTVYHNDFNRKDLLTQHLRRMHAAPANASSPRTQKEYPVNEDNIREHQDQCFRRLRYPPSHSQCLFCPEQFDGPNSWDQRMEHLGRHLERDRKEGFKLCNVNNWNVDKQLEKYLLEEGIIAMKNGEWVIGDGKPRRPALEDEDDEDSDSKA